MKTFRCEEIMCDGCVARIDKALDEAGIGHKTDLSQKTVAIEGDEEVTGRAVELLDDLGFSAVEV